MTEEHAVGVRVGKIKASQIRGAPNYPVQNIYPCSMSEGVEWVLNPLQLSSGLLVKMDGIVSYAPAMVQRMRIVKFSVGIDVQGIYPETQYKLRLLYVMKDGQAAEQFSAPISNEAREDTRFMFDIPLEHIDRDGWFTCALSVQLKTPMTGDERDQAIAQGREEPMEPVLVRGSWLEIGGG